MNKRGQITIFIIIGLVLVSLAVFAYIFYNFADEGISSFPNDPLTSDKINPIKEQMSLCLEGRLKKGITFFGLSKPDLEKYITENMDECIQFSSFEAEGFVFNRKNLPIIEITTSEKVISLDVEPRIIVTFATNKSKIPSFSIDVILNSKESILTDGNGIVKETVYLNSSDNNAQLIIPKGTKITGSLNELKISIKNNEQISYKYFLFASTYNFGPDGVTFEPSVPLTISYDPAFISSGQNVNDLKISYYDTSTKSWILVDTEVDEANHVLKASISHFTEYTVSTSSTTPPTKDFRVFTYNPTKAYFTILPEGNTIYTGTYADDISSLETYFSHVTTFDVATKEQNSDCVAFSAESVFRIRKFKDNLYATLEHGNYNGKDQGPRDRGAIWKLENGEWVWKHSVATSSQTMCFDLVANSNSLFADCGGTLEVSSDGNSWKSYPIPDGGNIWRMAELNGSVYIGANTKNCDWGCGGTGILLIYNASTKTPYVWKGETFTKVVPPANDLSDWALHGITAFKGKIYVGTVSDIQDKAYIYSYNPVDGLFKQVYKVEGRNIIHWMGNDGNYIYAGIAKDNVADLFRSVDGINWEKVDEFEGGLVIDGTVDSDGYMYIAGGEWHGPGTIWWNGPGEGGERGCSTEGEGEESCTAAQWIGANGWKGPAVTVTQDKNKCGHHSLGCDCTSCGLSNYCGDYEHGQTTKWCSKNNAFSCSSPITITCNISVDSCASEEGNTPECLSNPEKWYLEEYPDVKADPVYGTVANGGLKHWCEHGKTEGRQSCFKEADCPRTSCGPSIQCPEAWYPFPGLPQPPLCEQSCVYGGAGGA